MTDTLPNVDLPLNTWVDLNTETGITVGTALLIENLSREQVKIARQTTGTPTGDGFNLAGGQSDPDSWVSVDAGEPRVWARVEGGTESAQLNVQDDS